jgi:hypothetical protein
MPTFVLLKNDTDIVDQRWYPSGAFPDQPNPTKGLTWYILQESYPTPGPTEKIEGHVWAIDHAQGIAVKTYLLVSKTAEELAQEAAIAQRAQDIIDGLPTWQRVSDAIDAVSTIAGLKVVVKKLARVVYWLAKNSAT